MTRVFKPAEPHEQMQPPGELGVVYIQQNYAFDAAGNQVGDGPFRPLPDQAPAAPKAKPAPPPADDIPWNALPMVSPDQKFMAFRAEAQRLVAAGAPIEGGQLPSGPGSKTEIIAWLDAIGKLAV